MDKRKMTEYIKVNFPLTAESFATGNGEGMWVLVDRETKAAHDADETGGVYTGILDNDSIYYPGLNAGAVVRWQSSRASWRSCTGSPRRRKKSSSGSSWRATWTAGKRQIRQTRSTKARCAATASSAGISTASRSRTT